MQVISNLVANSIHAMPGGGHLFLSVEDTDEPAKGVVLTLSDDVVGIAPSNVPRVFEPFFTTRSTVGTGIGLFVAKQLIEGHGGQINIEARTMQQTMAQQFESLCLCGHPPPRVDPSLDTGR